MRHILPDQGGRGNSERRPSWRAPKWRVRLRVRFDQRPRAVDRQTGVSAAFDGRTAAAPRRAGADHRLPRHHLRRRGGAGARPSAANPRRHGDRRSTRVADLAAERLAQLRRPADALARPQEVLAQALPPWATARRTPFSAHQCRRHGAGGHARTSTPPSAAA